MTTQPATDFPIPADLEGLWLWDKLHCPRPLAPLDQDLLVGACITGFNRTMAEMGSIIRLGSRFINYYSYASFLPADLGGKSKEQALAESLRRANDLMPRLGALWRDELLPSLLPGLEKLRTTDYARLSDDELLRTFEELRAEAIDRWAIHGKINYLFYAAGLFADFYKEALKPANENEGYEVLQGFPSLALDSSRELWRLSRLARANPELRRLFAESRPEELQSRLSASEAGRDFLKELAAYLDRFGWRSDSVFELTKPAWREDPGIALNAIQGYIDIGDEGGPEAQYQQAVRHREQLLAEARRKLASDPEKLRRFNELYETASAFTPVAEDHNHYIDQMGDIGLRYPALEIGRRLVAKGLLTRPEDVFMLHFAEVCEALRSGRDYKALAAERRAEIERWAQVVPPPAIGVPGEPSGDPVEELLLRFFGTPVEPSQDPTVINGIPASPGTARGPAKVVRDLEEASKLNPGDVLVCEMTLPPWTPLFATACAVVADTGGVLSHCAIVAREYRIPCVVGTAIGTAVIKDGMTITVDGSKGIVRIEPA